jgi:TonB-linked SusC/RagA family outer membrane protein
MENKIDKSGFSVPDQYLTNMNNKLTSKIPVKALLLFLFLLPVFSGLKAQDSIQVTGIIVNGSGEPLSGVAVSVEGSFALPVVTEANGQFTLKSPSGTSWLIVAPHGGYKDKRFYLNNRANITIYLTPTELVSGDDGVSYLARQVLKRNIISTYSSLYTQHVSQTPAMTIDQYMQGRIPGMYVVNRSGDPGSGAVTLIRGSNSLNTTNQPLYIIDGIPMTPQGTFGSNLDGYSYNPLIGVNVLDISKTTIVKDPAVTAAYGSKASNGLVVIETLDPSATETRIDLDLRTGMSLSPPNLIPQLDATQHKTLINEVLSSSGMLSERIRELYPNLFIHADNKNFIDYQHDTKWQDLIFANSMFSNLNLSVKGGDEIARYGLSFGFMDNNGIIKNTGFQGYNLKFVSLLNIFTWLKMNAAVSLNYNSSNLKESGIIRQTSPILTALAKSPMLNPYQYDSEGKELKILSEVEELGVSNPLAVINNYEAKNSNYYFISTIGFDASIKKNLLLNTTFGLTYNILKEQIFMPNHGMEHYYNNEAINVAKASNNSITAFNNTTNLRYFRNFGNDHYLSSTTGVNIMRNDFEFDWGLTKNAQANDEYRMLQDGTNNLRQIGGDSRLWTWLSFFENVVYTFKDRYLATASVSFDGSSRVGDNAAKTIKVGGAPFGLFYSGGLAWRVSGESFLKNLSWLEELKLRVSAGVSGNDDIGEASATRFYRSIKFRETVGLFPATYANDKLSYERLNQLNGGIDISLLGNRLTGTFDVFSKTTSDMLIYTALESYLGYGFRPENGGKMRNQGWEASVFARIVNTPNFKWDIEANLSYVKNRIVSILGNKLVMDIPGAQIVNMNGAPANSFYGYIYDGVFQTTDEAISVGLVNNRNKAFTGGDAHFRDISGPQDKPDGVINDYDKTIIGSALPDYFGGISTTFTYKRWSVTPFVQFVKGNEVFNYVRYQNERMINLDNQSASVLNRWEYEGDQSDVPRALWNDPIGNSDFSTRWIEDGSYLRLKNVVLSYTIPEEFLVFRNAQFYISASNVYTLSKYLGYDPEFGYSQEQLSQGIDYGLTPQPRQFIVGIKLGL